MKVNNYLEVKVRPILALLLNFTVKVRVVFSRGPQSPGHGLVLYRGLLETRPHSRT